ncbi:MAG: hypothetical protein ABI867_37830, partial [Kofleriaceae bacterium]
MAKRSPILGYNHNVRYRGLVFHVQTEDSGVLSPHLFTHLFYTGVIVSTRKLVYDSGSAEESIKSLMQAQHKAVLKDLRRGHFDDKIDEYLGTTPGLLPRGTIDLGTPPGEPVIELEPPKLGLIDLEDTSSTRHDPTIPDVGRPAVGRAQTPIPRTQTAERKSAPTAVRSVLDRVTHEQASSLEDLGAVAVAISAASNATVRTAMPVDMPLDIDVGAPIDGDFSDSSPEIEIQLELDEPDELPPIRSRTPRDTDVALPGGMVDEHTRPTIDVSALSDGIPKRSGESIPPLPPPPLEKRPSAGVGASALPPARPVTRPP